ADAVTAAGAVPAGDRGVAERPAAADDAVDAGLGVRALGGARVELVAARDAEAGVLDRVELAQVVDEPDAAVADEIARRLVGPVAAAAGAATEGPRVDARAVAAGPRPWRAVEAPEVVGARAGLVAQRAASGLEAGDAGGGVRAVARAGVERGAAVVGEARGDG